MSPRLEPGDGFVAIPAAVTGPPSPGDVVVYQSRGLEPGELVTHRVVDETDQGYVTKGDANPFSDQDGSEPIVEPGQIKAHALAFGGNIVVVPKIGVGITALQDGLRTVQRQVSILSGSRRLLGTSGLGYLLLGSGVLLLAASVFIDSGRRRERTTVRSRSRPVVRLSLVILLLSVLVVGPATIVMTVSSGTQTFSFVSSATPSSSSTVVRSGSTTTGNYSLSNTGFIPVFIYFEPQNEGIDVVPSRLALPGGTSANTTITIDAPTEPGYYERSYAEHRYFAFLPRVVTNKLYQIHPLVALAAVDAVMVAEIAVLVVFLFGTRPLSVRIPSRENAFGTRLWKLFR